MWLWMECIGVWNRAVAGIVYGPVAHTMKWLTTNGFIILTWQLGEKSVKVIERL